MQVVDILKLATEQQTRIRLANLLYDPLRRQLFSGDVPVELEPKSRDLLERLLRQVGKPVSTEELILELWGSEHVSRNVLTNRIGSLRSTLNQVLEGDVDATRLLVTYPRQGYLIENAFVSLESGAAGNSPSTPSRLASQSFFPNEPERERLPAGNSRFWLKALGVGLVGGLLLGFFGSRFFLPGTDVVSGPAVSNDSGGASPGVAVTVMPVSLLLGEFTVQEPHLESLRVPLKAMILNRVLNTPGLDLANQDAPTYFLESLTKTSYWPGHKALVEADWYLDAHLHQDGEVPVFQWKMRHARTGKTAAHGRYPLPGGLTSERQQLIQQDLLHTLSLPAMTPLARDIYDERLEAGFAILLAESSDMPLSELEATVLSRQLVRAWPASAADLAEAIALIKRQFGQPTDELGIWLSLLLALNNEEKAALSMLQANVRRRSFDNAFIHLLQSDLARRLGDGSLFRSAYLGSLAALRFGVEGRVLFVRLSEPESLSACLSPWSQMLSKELVSAEGWIERLGQYCQFVENSLRPDRASLPLSN